MKEKGGGGGVSNVWVNVGIKGKTPFFESGVKRGERWTVPRISRKKFLNRFALIRRLGERL